MHSRSPVATTSDNFFYMGFFAALYAINISGVLLVALLLRRWFSRLSLAWSFVASQTLLLLLCVALYPTGIFFAQPPVDDLYAGFFLFPDVHLYLLAGKLFLDPLMDHGFSNWLFQHVQERNANLIGLIFLPAVPCVILGAVQWYTIGKVVEWFSKRGARNATKLVQPAGST
jgi:hypothetical protein